MGKQHTIIRNRLTHRQAYDMLLCRGRLIQGRDPVFTSRKLKYTVLDNVSAVIALLGPYKSKMSQDRTAQQPLCVTGFYIYIYIYVPCILIFS